MNTKLVQFADLSKAFTLIDKEVTTMRKMLLLSVLALFILPLFPNPASAGQALEVRCEKDPNAPWPFWTVAPLSGLTPNMFSTTGCLISDSAYPSSYVSGFKNFDQTWGPLVVPASGKVNFQFIQAGGLTGSFKVYICANPGESGVQVLDLTSVQSYCAWSAPQEIDLRSLGFTPDQTYCIRLVDALNAHALYAFWVLPQLEIGVDLKTWGWIKTLFE